MMITLILLISSLCGCWSTPLDQQVVFNPPCDSFIYCHGPLLHEIQMHGPFKDSKTFVDMKMKLSPNETKNIFNKLIKTGKLDIKKFINKYFEPEGSEFERWFPSDWNSKPKFIENIKDPKLQDWARKLNLIWENLGKKIKDDVRLHPELYSMIYVPNPIIIPGGRFRELYYWDTYWIIRGLLLCEMYDTAKGMINNYLYMIKNYGHIPNGNRIYYIKRSQPPMILPMVKSYVEATNDKKFLKQNIGMLEKEFLYWINVHTVVIKKDGINYTLARYAEPSSGPRPESYREDITKSESLKTNRDKEHFYSELKAAAESGWDFSSRWFIRNKTNQGKLLDLKTRSIIPVDLNALMYWGAKILSEFYQDMNMPEKTLKYKKIADQWKEAVTAVLWNEEVGAWLDYDTINNIKRNYFYPTNISPLWTGCFDRNKTNYFVSRVLKYLNGTIPKKTMWGIPTTLKETDEQWDQPNAWPPLQYIMIMSLDSSGDKVAQNMAYNIADRWMETNYEGFIQNNAMFEKYHVLQRGSPGVSSGEYEMQLGFGWTNGIILEFLQKYGHRVSTNNWGTNRKNKTLLYNSS